MAFLATTQIIKNEKIKIESTKIGFKIPDSLELLIEKELCGNIKVGLGIKNETYGMTYVYELYSSSDIKEIEQKYQDYLAVLKSGNYKLTFDLENHKAEFLIT